MQYRKTGSGAALIYVPGMEGSGELFFLQEPALARKFTVITTALTAQLPFDYESLCDDLLSVVREQSNGPVTLVAESFGGTIALQFALGHPELLNRLVLVNTF